MTGRKKFTHFIAMMDDESARRDAAVNIVLGTMTPGVEPVGTLMHGYETGTKVVSSDFEYFIPTAIESHTLSLTQVDHKAVVYPPVTFNKRFEAGHSYTIYVSLLN